MSDVDLPSREEYADLLEEIRAIPAGTRVRVAYNSARSDDPVRREGVARDHDEPLYVATDEMKGDVVVQAYYALRGDELHHLGARSTQGPFGHGAALGELLDVEVLDG